MRKRVKKKTIGRDSSHRKALLKTLSTQLVIHEKITTTTAKAKFLRPHVEKLITKAKRGSDLNNLKFMKKMLTTNEAVDKMLEDIGPRFKTRPGGYTRIIKVGNRQGDNAPLARIELVEKPAAKTKTKKTKKKTKKVEDKGSKQEKKTKETKSKSKSKKPKEEKVKKKTRGRPKKTSSKKKAKKK